MLSEKFQLTIAERKLTDRVRRKFREGIRTYQLIAPGDHVLVGLSGGKDSMALLQLLGEYRRHAAQPFGLSALHVRIQGIDYRSDARYLEDFARKQGADFYLQTCEMPADRNARRTPCFLCSWTRRKALFTLAQTLGCQRIALGHHRDDILTTALMNLTYNGSFSTMPVRQAFRKMPLEIIRPLCRVGEEDLRAWAQIYQYEPLLKVCPHDVEGHRTGVRNWLETMQAMNPEAKSSLWHALHKADKLVELDEAL